MAVALPMEMASTNSDLGWRRPLLLLLSRGRCHKPGARPARQIVAPFASVSAASQPGEGQTSQDSATSGSETSSDSGAERFTSLVQLESDPLITVIFPQWMVEVYQELVVFGSACKRLFLPENSIKSKLPYYREAVSDPGSTVVMNPKLENLMESYRKYGRYGRFVTSSTVDRSRGPRFEMPSPGMKTITAVEVVLTWWLATLYV